MTHVDEPLKIGEWVRWREPVECSPRPHVWKWIHSWGACGYEACTRCGATRNYGEHPAQFSAAQRSGIDAPPPAAVPQLLVAPFVDAAAKKINAAICKVSDPPFPVFDLPRDTPEPLGIGTLLKQPRKKKLRMAISEMVVKATIAMTSPPRVVDATMAERKRKPYGPRKGSLARNAEIVRLILAGMPRPEIAAKFQVTTSRVTQIWIAHERGALPQTTALSSPGLSVPTTGELTGTQ